MQPTFEQNSWSRIDITPEALDKVEAELIVRGVSVESLDIRPHLAGYRAYLQLPAYAGEYRTYGGDSMHCLLEKSLEHWSIVDSRLWLRWILVLHKGQRGAN